MPLNLIKLAVGADSIEDLQTWVDWRVKTFGEQIHTTRQTPKRRDDVLDGGSLYWVIKGSILCRQRVLELRDIVDADGVPRCEIVLEPIIVRLVPRPRGPFQGWRYLEPKDAPSDLSTLDAGEVPEDLAKRLREMGAW